MELYVGLDLHSRNTYIGIMDNDFKRVFKKRVPNHLELILQTLDPFQSYYQELCMEKLGGDPFFFNSIDKVYSPDYFCALPG